MKQRHTRGRSIGAWAVVTRVGLLGGVCVLSGCGIELMTTPAVLEGRDTDYLAYSHADDTGVTIPVFVAHARRENPEETELDRRFTADLSRSLHLGKLPVRVGTGVEADEVLAMSLADTREAKVWLDASAEGYTSYGVLGFGRVDRLGRYDQQQELVRLFTRRSADVPLGGDAFAEAINAELERRGSKTVTIYVHGFNTRFIDNVCRSGELSHYLGQ
ncbi:MAG: alpha/beta hydrolase, partial [Pseudomonadota bacterium]